MPPLQAPLPPGLSLRSDSDPDLTALHALLQAAYVKGFGSVAELAPWRAALVSDSEYDPRLVFLVRDPYGCVAAAAQCWSTGFIKDFAVCEDWRRRGVGAALLSRIFATFAARGATHVDLKVESGNAAARALYARAGFEPVNSP